MPGFEQVLPVLYKTGFQDSISRFDDWFQVDNTALQTIHKTLQHIIHIFTHLWWQ